MTLTTYGFAAIAASYTGVGLVLGLADPWLGEVARSFGVRPGWATATSVNLLLPLTAVVLGVAHRRAWLAMLGAVMLTPGFTAGLAVRYAAGIPDWSPAGLLSSVPPALVLAAIGYAIVGVLAVAAGRCVIATAHE
jgi:hypothetical protein